MKTEAIVFLVVNILCWVVFVGPRPTPATAAPEIAPKELNLSTLKVTESLRMKSESGEQDLLIEAKKKSVGFYLNNAKGTLTMFADESSVPYFEIKEKDTGNKVTIYIKDNKPMLEIIGPDQSGHFPLELLIEWMEP